MSQADHARITSPSRRRLLLVATGPAFAAPAAALARIAPADSDLVAWAREYVELEERHAAEPSWSDDYEAIVNGYMDRQDALRALALDTPATSLAGFRAKARMLHIYLADVSGDLFRSDDPEAQLAYSLVNDILAANAAM